MIHEPFANVDEMISIDAMSALEGRTVRRVEVEQWNSAQPLSAASGCEFLTVRTCASGESNSYFVKLTHYATDLIRRLSDDHECRERLLWQHGVIDCLPPELKSPMLAHACDGEGWALLMRDISVYLQKLERRRAGTRNVLNWSQVCTIVDALAALHTRFYRASVLDDAALNLCTGYQMYAWLRPEVLAREAVEYPQFTDRQATGWTLLDRLESKDVAEALGALRVDPTPLVNALARYPVTLVHGDPKRD